MGKLLKVFWFKKRVDKKMRIVKALMDKKYGLIGLIVFLIIMLWPSIPLGSIELWFETLINLYPTNILYPIMAFLSASYTSLFLYSRDAKVCDVDPKKGAGTSLVGILLGACPACIPAIGFFLPLSVTVTLSYYSWIFLTGSVILLAFLIYNMGGFKE